MRISSPKASPPSPDDLSPEIRALLEQAPRDLSNGRYSIHAVLGIGGMATVYKAWDHHLAVYRAIKVLSPQLADRPAIRSRFVTEARAMARLRHPHVVSIQDVIDTEGRIFIVMDLIGGGTAWERVAREGPWAEDDAVRLVANIADAVQAAHNAGIVHRDIKPQNILLTLEGEGRLTDFGIARFDDVRDPRSETRTGTIMGTWGFMPPEQRNDASKVETRSDIYALGATLWALIRGTTPTDLFMADREPEMTEGFSPPVARVLMQATRYRPGDRYDSAGELARVLREIVPDVHTAPVRPASAAAPTDDPSGTLVALLDPLANSESTVSDPDFISDNTVSDDILIPAPEPDTEARPLVEDDHYGRRRPGGLASMAIGAAMVAAVGLAVGSFAILGTKLAPPAAPVEPGPAVRAPVGTPPDEPIQLVYPKDPTPPPPAVIDPVVPDAPVATTPAPPSTTPPSNPARPPAGKGKSPSTTPPPDPPPPEAPSGSNEPPPEGHVVATGEFVDLWMEDDHGAQFEPGLVPAGRYTVYARFHSGGDKVVAALVDVKADQAVRLDCNAQFLKCKPQR